MESPATVWKCCATTSGNNFIKKLFWGSPSPPPFRFCTRMCTCCDPGRCNTPAVNGPMLCKFGGARMAHKAKDRVTNQEFPSCHSWERKRGQKLRIKRVSLERKRRRTSRFLRTFQGYLPTLRQLHRENFFFLCFVVYLFIFFPHIFHHEPEHSQTVRWPVLMG